MASAEALISLQGGSVGLNYKHARLTVKDIGESPKPRTRSGFWGTWGNHKTQVIISAAKLESLCLGLGSQTRLFLPKSHLNPKRM